MTKSPSRANAESHESEARVLETLKQQSDMAEALAKVFSTSGRKKQLAQCEEFADELNCSVEVLRRAWQKFHQNMETKQEKGSSSESKRKSTNLNMAELRQTRRSLRSQSIDKTISVASSIVADSTDNSCASSVCGSPQPAEKSSHRASTRNLCAISEDEIDPRTGHQPVAAAAATTDSPPQQQQQQPNGKGTEATSPAAGGPPPAIRASGDRRQAQVVAEAVCQRQEEPAEQTPGGGAAKFRALPRESTNGPPISMLQGLMDKYLEEVKQVRSLRLSEPLQSTIGSSRPRLQYSKEDGPTLPTKSSLTKPEDPTRVFFDSIALTVMRFPPYLQASIKVKVSSIVHELEYELCLPPHAAEKMVAVAS